MLFLEDIFVFQKRVLQETRILSWGTAAGRGNLLVRISLSLRLHR